MYNDHGARNLCLQTGRWTGVDELAQQYWETSPFVSMGNNPVKFVDLDGKEIDEASREEWDAQKQNVINKRDMLQDKIERLNAKANEKGWSAEKLAKKVGNMQERVGGLNTAIANFNVLESSTQVYSLNSDAAENGVSYDAATQNIVISYSSTALFVHETTHAGQFETGDIAFNATNGATLAQDVYDEVGGYKAQWAYNPSSVGGLNSSNQISPEWVQGVTDKATGNQPYRQGGTANTGIAQVNVNSTRDELISAYPHQKSLLQTFPAGATLKSIIPTIYTKKR
jgi:hypothetical protein